MPGNPNNHWEQLLSQNCRLALNSFDPILSILIPVGKIKNLPKHKVFYPVAGMNGLSTGRLGNRSGHEVAVDLKTFENFKAYLNNQDLQVWLSPIEKLFSKHTDEEFFNQLIESNLLATNGELFPLDANL